MNSTRHACSVTEQLVEIAKVDNVRDLKVYFLAKELKNPKRNQSISPFELTLRFKVGSLKYVHKLALINVRPDQIFVEGQKYSKNKIYSTKKYKASNENTLLNGTRLVRGLDSYTKTSTFLGALHDLYGDKKAIKCKEVSRACSLESADQCHLCRYGWYEVVDYYCDGGGSRYCGSDRCGERSMPACPRGKEIVKLEDNKKSICYDGSPHGYCQDDLKTVCDGNNILICL